MHFWVYLLRCRDGSYYAGHTDQLEARLWQHQQGIACDWTRRRRPVVLVWCDTAPTRDEAFAFERQIKGWSRAKKEALIARDWERVHELSRSTEARIRSARPERSEAKSKGVCTEIRPDAVRLRAPRSAQDERFGVHGQTE